MYNNVLLFGSRGHLARTKIIPALKSCNLNYVPLSRRYNTNLDSYIYDKNIAYLSIPSQHIIECMKPYMSFLENNKPLFVVEKPHGIDYKNFLELKEFFESHNHNVIYNDHYIAKHALLTIPQLPEFKNVRKIDLKLHESSCVNDRIDYFDKAGIVLDMYQSHSLIVLATVIARIENTERSVVLQYLSKCIPFHKEFSKYESYKGSNFTKCHIKFIYKGINITVSCGKKMTDEKSLCITIDNGSYTCIDLSNNVINPYINIFNWLNNNNIELFLQTSEITSMWKHINLL